MTYRAGSNTLITITDYASSTFASNGAFASVFYKNARALYNVQGETYGYSAGGGDPGMAPTPIATIRQSVDRFPFAVSVVNASNIGNITTGRMRASGQSSVTHGYVSGGFRASDGANSDAIERFSYASSFSSGSVGTLSAARSESVGQSSLTHGYITAAAAVIYSISIERFPFAQDSGVVSAGVGSLPAGRRQAAGVSSFDYGYIAGGLAPGSVTTNSIDRFPFSVASVSSRSVGTLAIAFSNVSGQNSYDYGFISGGLPPVVTSDAIQRFPFAAATTSAADVGSLSILSQDASGQSSFSHGYHSGSSLVTTPTVQNIIGRFPFASASIIDAANVGTLTVNRGYATGHQS